MEERAYSDHFSDKQFANIPNVCYRNLKCAGALLDGGSLMGLLLDEMYAGLKEYFEILGWNVLTVHDVGLQGAKDIDVVKYAKEMNLILVTQDPKPADLAEMIGARYVLISNALIAKIADVKIREKYPDVKDC